MDLRVVVEETTQLRFDDGSPVRAASAIAAFGGGWLVVQDDATHAAWWRDGSITPVRVVPAVDGHEVFSAAAGTKQLKPDFEAACDLGAPGVLLLGSGSAAGRTRASLVTSTGYRVVELAALYDRVAACLGIARAELNLEGACPLGTTLRWFQRGNSAAGVASAAVDVDLPALLAVVSGSIRPEAVPVRPGPAYDLGTAGGVALAVTDAVALGGGRMLVSAAAEATPNAVDDGPVTGSALALLDGDQVLAVAALPSAGGPPPKVEGLAVLTVTATGARLVAVVDADDPATPSARLRLHATW